jgi:acyl-CoA hydrolase
MKINFYKSNEPTFINKIIFDKFAENKIMNTEERIEMSETRQFKIVFHNAVNDHKTLFGGTAMQWMDEVAYITAKRFARMNMVTVSSEKIEFLKPIQLGSIVEIVGKVVKVGNVKINIRVEIFVEEVDTYSRNKAVEAVFTFVAINGNSNPVRIDFEEKAKLIFSYT